MQVVYIDMLFLLNGLVNYLLLLSSARLAGEVIRRLRILRGAMFGGLFAVVVCFLNLSFLTHPLIKIGVAVVMVLVAFGGAKRLLRVTLVFFGVAAAFGGGIFAIQLLGQSGSTFGSGVFYSAMDIRLILLSAAGCYGLITLVFQRLATHTVASGELVPAVLTLEGRQVTLMALVDTGNTMTDPVSGRPVMVAEGEKLRTLFVGEEFPNTGQLKNPAQAIEGLTKGRFGLRYRLLSYRAVGVDGGMLLAIRLDKVVVNGEDYGKLLVALSPNSVSDGGGYSALIGA